jgi:hypothetical protein
MKRPYYGTLSEDIIPFEARIEAKKWVYIPLWLGKWGSFPICKKLVGGLAGGIFRAFSRVERV